MKHFENHIPSVLLFGYAVYTAFTPINIAHSIIILSLAILFGFHFHISRQEITKLNQQSLDSLKNEMELKINGIKEFHEKKISKLEDDLNKLLLNALPKDRSSSSSSAIPPRKLVF